MPDLLSQYIHASGRTGLLCLYLVAHLCVGFLLPDRNAKPFFFLLVEKLGKNLESRLNRETRTQKIRFIRGLIIVLAIGAGGTLAGYSVAQAGQMRYGWIIELLFLSICINVMSPVKLTRRLYQHLGKNELPKAAGVLQPYLQEPLEKVDMHGMVRKGIEFIVASLNRFLAAPAFWFLLTGFAGLAFYTTCSALQQAFGMTDGRHKYFGRVARNIDTLLNIAPAFLTALLLAVSALFVSRAHPLRAASAIFRRPGRYRPPYLIWPVAAVAGGLGVTLGGPIRYSADYVEERPWVGPQNSSARLMPEDLGRAGMLQYVFFLCALGIISVLLILAI